ncbi:MAG: T9SS type A sorting domain-containing protein [Fidelibacterota bacterium]
MITIIESLVGEVATGGKDEKPAVPGDFSVSSIYPNPFNPATTIEFISQVNALVTLTVYDLLGRELDTIFDQYVRPGRHKVSWRAKNIPSGIYFLRMEAVDPSRGSREGRVPEGQMGDSFAETRKVIVLR